jgi:signal transduction histidine kinase
VEAVRLYRKCNAARKELRLTGKHAEYFEEDKISYPRIEEEYSARILPALDVEYLMKSSLAISAEIEQESLLKKILNLVVQCSGAQRGYLLIGGQDNLFVRAESRSDEKEAVRICNKKLEDAADVCKAIVRYVYRTGERLILNNASQEGEFKDNLEVQTMQLRSVLCLPVVKQTETVGILYLENRLSDGIFTPGKTGMTEMLASQAAISLENARLVDETTRLNVELKEHVAQLEASNGEIEAFNYSVSHDLRTPLRGMDGLSKIVLEDYYESLDDKGRDYLRRIRASCQRMGLLIDGLLNLSRLSRSEIVREQVNLSALANEIAVALKNAQPERAVEFVIADGLIDEGDRNMLHVVLQNLLDNSWKFTEKHASARIEFGVTMNDGKPAYFVRDNGAGFDMAFADKLFRPFHRLHSEREFGGTGIGLATIHRVINRHGGRVWAEGETEKGATFYFTLE